LKERERDWRVTPIGYPSQADKLWGLEMNGNKSASHLTADFVVMDTATIILVLQSKGRKLS
jgi:hypothetical protein